MCRIMFVLITQLRYYKFVDDGKLNCCWEGGSMGDMWYLSFFLFLFLSLSLSLFFFFACIHTSSFCCLVTVLRIIQHRSDMMLSAHQTSGTAGPSGNCSNPAPVAWRHQQVPSIVSLHWLYSLFPLTSHSIHLFV